MHQKQHTDKKSAKSQLVKQTPDLHPLLTLVHSTHQKKERHAIDYSGSVMGYQEKISVAQEVCHLECNAFPFPPGVFSAECAHSESNVHQWRFIHFQTQPT